MAKRNKKHDDTPTFQNRKARHDYEIVDTLEVGIKLSGSEVKAIRDGLASIAEGFVTVKESPKHALTLHGVHIGVYPAAGPIQHTPVHDRALLAHKREIEKLARQIDQKGMTIVPLKMYFQQGLIKVTIGVARGRAAHDKRRAIAERESERELKRAMSRIDR
ncbi:MAG: SsrA-binding protein SmpB [Planctomycetota bacterium]